MQCDGDRRESPLPPPPPPQSSPLNAVLKATGGTRAQLPPPPPLPPAAATTATATATATAATTTILTTKVRRESSAGLAAEKRTVCDHCRRRRMYYCLSPFFYVPLFVPVLLSYILYIHMRIISTCPLPTGAVFLASFLCFYLGLHAQITGGGFISNRERTERHFELPIHPHTVTYQLPFTTTTRRTMLGLLY